MHDYCVRCWMTRVDGEKNEMAKVAGKKLVKIDKFKFSSLLGVMLNSDLNCLM